MTTSWNYDERIVAFIDVLGYKAFTKLEDEDARRIVELISRHLGGPRFDPTVNRFYTPTARQFSAKAFSDCIYLSDEVSEQGCRNVVCQAAALAHNLTVNGIYVRGGITSGRHFQDINILFGEGIVRAYEMEHVRAKNPRVLIERAVVDQLPDTSKALIATDGDGELFIDFWNYWEWEQPTFDLDLLYMTIPQREAAKVADFTSAKTHLDQNIAAAQKAGRGELTSKLAWLAAHQNARAQALLNAADAAAVTVNLAGD